MKRLNLTTVTRTMSTGLVIVTVILCGGCGEPSATEPAAVEEPALTNEREDLASPEPVTGQIAGKLQDKDTGDPVTGINLALMILGEGDGPWVPMEKTDFTARSDAEGAFLFENVPPNRYIIAADFNPISTSPNTMLRGPDGAGVTIELAADEAYNLGVVLVKKE